MQTVLRSSDGSYLRIHQPTLDTRKSFPAVLRILKQRDVHLTLCRELARIVQGNNALLDYQQFDLVIM